MSYASVQTKEVRMQCRPNEINYAKREGKKVTMEVAFKIGPMHTVSELSRKKEFRLLVLEYCIENSEFCFSLAWRNDESNRHTHGQMDIISDLWIQIIFLNQKIETMYFMQCKPNKWFISERVFTHKHFFKSAFIARKRPASTNSWYF